MISVAALPSSYLDLPVFGFVDHAHLPTGFPFTIHKQPASGSDFITKAPVYHPSHIKKLLMWRSAGDGSIVKSKNRPPLMHQKIFSTTTQKHVV